MINKLWYLLKKLPHNIKARLITFSWILLYLSTLALQARSLVFSEKWTSYIQQVSLEAPLIQGLLEETERQYQKQDPKIFWSQSYLLGHPNHLSNHKWFSQGQTIYLENAYTQLKNGSIEVIVDFGHASYIHPDLGRSRVVFRAMDADGNPLRKDYLDNSSQKTQLNHWRCYINKYQNPQTRSFGHISNMYDSPIFITSLLPYPYVLCKNP